MLYGHRNIAMLYGGPCLNLIYISALPHRGNWGWGRMSGGERGTEKREERYLFVFYWLRRSRFQISHRAECSKHPRSFLCRFIYNPARRILLIDRSRPFRKFHETIFSKYSQPLVKRAFSRERKGRRERERAENGRSRGHCQFQRPFHSRVIPRKRFGSSVRDETRMNGIAHLNPRYQAYYRVRHYPAFD